MHARLKEFAASGGEIGVLLVGAGAMGVGIAWQLARVPGMRLAGIVDLDRGAAEKAAAAYGKAYVDQFGQSARPDPQRRVVISNSPRGFIENAPGFGLSVLVEATNSIGFAGRLCEDAIAAGLHVVLMNAEVDLAMGHELAVAAAARGLVVTSDAGDQHGVLARMIDEIRMWAFDIVLAGNIKGFLNRHATAASLAEEARIRNLNPIQCCAYTDGTKLNIEMALIANGAGLDAPTRGMHGPRVANVTDVLGRLPLPAAGQTGVVDYILGAEPGGGVFVIGRCEDPLQAEYLRYYKLGKGPEYLFYRPYHLCHLETPWAVAEAALDKRAVLRPAPRRTDTYALAKIDLTPGMKIDHALGGDHLYGEIENARTADAEGLIPIVRLEAEGEGAAEVLRPVKAGQALTRDDVRLPETWLNARLGKN